MKKKMILKALMFFSTWNIQLFANDQKIETKIATIGVIDGESNTDMSIVNIRFDKKPNFESVAIEDHQNFLQINLPDTMAPNSGQFIDVKSPFIKKIAVFQINPTTSAVRLFVEKDADLIKKATEAQILNNRLVVTTAHDSVTTSNNSQITTIETPAIEEKPVAAAVPTKKSIEDLTANIVPTKNTFELKDKLYKVAGFLGVLFLLLILTLILKPMIEKKKRQRLGENYTPMRLLGDLQIAPKQKLSLVQIGHEQILISVSPDNINFIQRIGESKTRINEQTPTLRDSLATSNLIGNNSEMRSPKVSPKQQNFSINEEGDFFDKPSKKNAVNEKTYTQSNVDKKNYQKINVQIDDDGISTISNKKAKDGSDNSKSIEDVTKIIREKLKNLPSM